MERSPAAPAWPPGTGQELELHIESDLEGLGDGRQLTYRGVAPTALQGRNDRLGDIQPGGELLLGQSDLLAGGPDPSAHQLRVNVGAPRAWHRYSATSACRITGRSAAGAPSPDPES
jgi:hypothetical protein